jgi:hypothetical protein
MADDDCLYKRLFDHPDIVGDLLREFLAGYWLDGLGRWRIWVLSMSHPIRRRNGAVRNVCFRLRGTGW